MSRKELMEAVNLGYLKFLPHGMRIALTGKMSMKRDELVELIEVCGGIYHSSINNRTTHLVVGRMASGAYPHTSKVTIVLTEAELVDMIRGPASDGS